MKRREKDSCARFGFWRGLVSALLRGILRIPRIPKDFPWKVFVVLVYRSTAGTGILTRPCLIHPLKRMAFGVRGVNNMRTSIIPQVPLHENNTPLHIFKKRNAQPRLRVV